MRLRGGMFDSTSGKVDFDYLLYTNKTVVKNIFRFDLNNAKGAHRVLADLYYEIENIGIHMPSSDLKNDIFPRMNNQEDSQ